ncbi:MAG: DUF6599 family protein [Polyangia bacterium]
MILTLAALAAACSSDRERPAAQASESRPPAAAEENRSADEPDEPEEMVFEGPGEKLPREVGEWSIASPPRYFGPENLYDLINGGAEIYVRFGLEKMVTADYGSPSLEGVTVTVEIYDMGSPRGAFGRTARFLASRVDPSDAGEGLPEAMRDRGILGSGDLVLWKDRYLAHLTLLDESPDATPESIAAAGEQVLPELAAAIDEKIEGTTDPPETLETFPDEHRLARSGAWHPGDLMGIEGLGGGYTVRYAEDEIEWTAFATEKLDDETAVEAAWKTVKSAETEQRRLAIRSSGKRVLGIACSSDSAPPPAELEKRADQLEKALARD